MDKKVIKRIQKEIGYKFKNKSLLEQAFTRKSYSEERGGENNEVLEFYGDSIVSSIVVKNLTKSYCSKAKDNEGRIIFSSNKTPEELTKLKDELIKNEKFAKIVKIYNWNEHLIMNEGDQKNRVNYEKGPMSDLFEAIIGAVAVDCNYNMRKLDKVVSKLLDLKKFLEEHK